MTKPLKVDPAALLIPVGQFIESDAHAIPVASLLSRKPELRDAALTLEQWRAELDADQATPTA